MKKIFVTAFVLFAFLIAPQAFAASPDAEVEGLWLTCPPFPEDAEVLEFEDDKDMDIVTYIRALDDGAATFEIRRQPIEESELQSPDDVAGLIEMRVNNDDIDEEAIEENIDSIDVDTDAEEFAEKYSYPCATAEYTTGQNEDTRKNAALFIFTDVYCFEVNVSLAADSAEDYEERMMEWFTGLEFTEAGGGADAPDAEVTGLWLEIPDFPKDAEADFHLGDDGAAAYMRTLDDGDFSLAIIRQPNPDNTINAETVVKFISGFAGIDEDDVKVNVPDPEDAPIPLFKEYPAALARYEHQGEDGKVHSFDMFFFPDEFFFWVHMEGVSEEALEKHEDDFEKWFTKMRIVER